MRETAELPNAVCIYLQHRERNDRSFRCNYRCPIRNSAVDLHFLAVAERIRTTQCFNPATVRDTPEGEKTRSTTSASYTPIFLGRSFFHRGLGNSARYIHRYIPSDNLRARYGRRRRRVCEIKRGFSRAYKSREIN